MSYIGLPPNFTSTVSFQGGTSISSSAVQLGQATSISSTLTCTSGTTSLYGASFTSSQIQLSKGVRYQANTITSNTTLTTTYCLAFVDNTSGTYTVTLPASPTAGDTYFIVDSTGVAQTHAITVSGNGNNINGASSFNISINNAGVMISYSGAQWCVMASFQGTLP